jgi:hypothetical protein
MFRSLRMWPFRTRVRLGNALMTIGLTAGLTAGLASPARAASGTYFSRSVSYVDALLDRWEAGLSEVVSPASSRRRRLHNDCCLSQDRLASATSRQP